MPDDPTKSLVAKYGQQTPEEMEKEQGALEAEHVEKCKEMEENISAFSSKIDELIVEGKTLAMVKRPTNSQFRRFTPPEMLKYSNHPEEIPPELAVKYETDMYALMAELIVTPKRTAEEWRDSTGDAFMAAFQAHLFGVRQKLAKETAAFLQQTLDTQS